jgi:ABC-type bacteriocin/lantibiotic exporter with double-glycine peptidase domain
MVLSYWGINRDQNRLARQLRMIPGVGVPASRLRRFASRNLAVHYGSGNLDDLRAALDEDIPPITLVNTKHFEYWQIETAHAVVVTAIDEQRMLINDPGLSQGQTSVGLNDFLLAWDEMANLYGLIQKV